MNSPDTEFIRIAGLPDRDANESSPRPADSSLPSALPVLGLSDIVVFPGMVVPLLVESAPSIRLIDDVVAGDRLVCLVLQRKPDTTDPRPDELFEVGCASRVLRMLKFPDNTVRILIEGLHRVRLKDFLSRDPYLRAECEPVTVAPEETMEIAALVRNIRSKFEEISELSPALTEQVRVAALNVEEPGKLADLIAGNVNLSLDERQTLLETPRLLDRLNRLLPLLAREAELLALGSKIQNEVTSSVNRNQREFFLREQMRAIQRELGEGEGAGSEIESLRAKIEEAGLPDEAREVARKELDRLQAMPPASAESTVARNYLDCILHLPWHEATEDKLDLARAERILDEQHHGLGKIKDRLIEFLAVMKLRREVKGPILCLVGPPGVGKTSLGRSVAEAMGRKFVRFALGGIRDEAEIRGHRRTYVGAMPGRIIQSLRRAGSNNPVMLLDELDKVGADFRGDPASALLEVLDPQQNHTFVDHYLDLPFDLSRVLFIATANWLDPVHPALRDRLEVIELASYTAEEKLQIARLHLVPRQLEEHGLDRKQLRLSDASLRCLIRDYTREAGVRQLEREIAAVTRKSARQILRRRRAQCLIIKAGDVEQMLGPARFQSENAERITECGIATGLAWTPVGGELLFIEVTRMPGAGKLILTGSLGDVMKESAQAALSYLRSQAPRLGLAEVAFDKQDLHIHVPAGATPKDGPSAGVTMVTALASLLTGRRVRSDVAMTGEISLRGRVLPVGGIKEKMLAAARAGIKRVILPAQNEKDWHEVPDEVRKKLEACFVRDVGGALEAGLQPPRGAGSNGANHAVSRRVHHRRPNGHPRASNRPLPPEVAE
ncbi:MAG: endopeptidase La [Verrucomicrobiales bacterium]|nr:endopeptidase La [Verrucomicrobiales bacterium]